jgi:hypothetical protein
MTKAKISEYDAVAANNTDVNGVNIAENCPPSGMNNMGREIMAALKRFQTGSDGDGVTVGGNLVVSGTSTLSTTSISSADINAGTIDGTAIGGSTPAAVSATTLNTSGAVVFNDAGADVDFRVESDTVENALFVDGATGNVGIGNTGNSSRKVEITQESGQLAGVRVLSGGSGAYYQMFTGTANTKIGSSNNTNQIEFHNDSGEAMRIDSSGNLLVGTTAVTNGTSAYGATFEAASNNRRVLLTASSTTVSQILVEFYNPNGAVGSISTNGSATAYNTSSDYRLKENVAPMQGALSKVLELNPVTYTWKVDGSAGEGFIAHELQAVVPDAVTGEKDATEIKQVEVSPAVPATYDEEGNELTPAVEAVYEEREVPKYQGVDSSFLVATLTAAIQELSAKNDALEARIAALETGV